MYFRSAAALDFGSRAQSLPIIALGRGRSNYGAGLCRLGRRSARGGRGTEQGREEVGLRLAPCGSPFAGRALRFLRGGPTPEVCGRSVSRDEFRRRRPALEACQPLPLMAAVLRSIFMGAPALRRFAAGRFCASK